MPSAVPMNIPYGLYPKLKSITAPTANNDRVGAKTLKVVEAIVPKIILVTPISAVLTCALLFAFFTGSSLTSLVRFCNKFIAKFTVCCYNQYQELIKLKEIFLMSHVKAGGSSKNIHNNPGRRLGVKRFGGEVVKQGEIIVRQVGASKIAGPGTYVSRNFTVHADRDGKVAFKEVKVRRFTGKTVKRTQITVQ